MCSVESEVLDGSVDLPEVLHGKVHPPEVSHGNVQPPGHGEDNAYVFMMEGDDEPPPQDPLEERAMKKVRRVHARSADAAEERARRRLAVEHERRTRTCGSPPLQDHQPGCSTTVGAPALPRPRGSVGEEGEGGRGPAGQGRSRAGPAPPPSPGPAPPPSPPP